MPWSRHSSAAARCDLWSFRTFSRRRPCSSWPTRRNRSYEAEGWGMARGEDEAEHRDHEAVAEEEAVAADSNQCKSKHRAVCVCVRRTLTTAAAAAAETQQPAQPMTPLRTALIRWRRISPPSLRRHVAILCVSRSSMRNTTVR